MKKMQINLLKPDMTVIKKACEKTGIPIHQALLFIKSYHLALLEERLDEKYIPLSENNLEDK